MSSPIRLGAAAFAALLVACLAACGGGVRHPAPGARAGTVVWQGTPQVFEPRGLPRDRVLIGRIRNPGTTMLKLTVTQVTVRDGAGHVVPGATAAFLSNYAHGLFGALQQPAKIPATEAARLGRLLYLFGGSSAPFFAAWHLPPGASGPMSVRIGRFTLDVPAGTPKLTAR